VHGRWVPCTIHAPWEVGTLVQSMGMNPCTLSAVVQSMPMEVEYPCTIHAPWRVGPLYNPWCMETMYPIYCCYIHGAWRPCPYLLLYNPCPMEVEYPCTIHAHGRLVPLYNPCHGCVLKLYTLCTYHAPWKVRYLQLHGAWIMQGYSDTPWGMDCTRYQPSMGHGLYKGTQPPWGHGLYNSR